MAKELMAKTIDHDEFPDREREIGETSYEEIINWREKRYDEDVAGDPRMEAMRGALDTHNRIVLRYADELIAAAPEMTAEEKTAARLAVIMHDGGKLNSALLSHHHRGAEYADEMLANVVGKKINGAEIAPRTIIMARRAIERHMNHPFLVKLQDNKPFPRPLHAADKIVFDADMLANIGFKNVAFELLDEKRLQESAETAGRKGVPPLEITFNNVISGSDGKNGGYKNLVNVVLTKTARKKAAELIETADKIFGELKKNGVLKKINREFSGNGRFDAAAIELAGGMAAIKKRLNEAIRKAGQDLGMDEKTVNNLLM